MIQSVPANYPLHSEDFLQDYTHALNESALTPRHLNQKLPDNRSREISMFCQALYDHYYWALVGSVYSCLQEGYILDRDDVEMSIELVCEESVKEINLTSFIQTICSHYRHETMATTLINLIPDDIVFNDSGTPIPPLNKPLQKVRTRGSSASSSAQSSKASGKNKGTECDNVKIQEEIKAQFLEILQKYFSCVPNNPYFLFFRQDLSLNESANETDSDGEVERQVINPKDILSLSFLTCHLTILSEIIYLLKDQSNFAQG